MLWTSAEAAAATGGQAIGVWAVDGVSIDTRTIAPSDLFVALKAVRDGHEFVAQALENGAGAAMVSHVPEGVSPDAPLLIVKDVLTALEDMGRVARGHTNARVIAVTGSVGKTSTKEMLREVLQRQGRTHAAEASYNNHWGVPLTLARMPRDTEFAVIELGMNHPGEISPLSKMARPHVAMITTVVPAHMEAFDNIEGIAHEKAAILDGLEPGGYAILNADIGTADILQDAAKVAGAKVILFGTAADAYHLGRVTLGDDATVVQADVRGAAIVFKISTAGRHFAMNGLGVLAAIDALGADAGIAAVDLAHWAPPSGRGTRETIVLDDAIEGAELSLIDDAYNANPTSLGAALEVLAAAKPMGVRPNAGQRIAILGDMLELGDDEVAQHAAIAELAFFDEVAQVHCVGPLMRHLWEALDAQTRGQYYETADEICAEIHRLIGPGDVVLVKGSKGIRVSLVVDAIRKMGHPTGNKRGNR